MELNSKKRSGKVKEKRQAIAEATEKKHQEMIQDILSKDESERDEFEK